ncbi:MAG: ABC-F family ATP-binding cassette domain-containing protein [Lachnospiraceae bacterium]|nr:ABC-F family ATP-binding cassette domain-containing protein [Lachnospiraceae bacterium]
MVLSCQNISISLGGEEIIKKADFHIEEREKAALVGINGAGKSTLLKIITGELNADSGVVSVTKNKKIGYLAQYQNAEKDKTLFENVLEGKRELIDMENELLSMEERMSSLNGSQLDELMEKYHTLSDEFHNRGGGFYKSSVTGLLKGLGFDESEFEKPMHDFSGGQNTRAAMARLLAEEPDILLLDEPTNHLDFASVVFLENYLKAYNGAVILVSHDRYFLDRIVTKVVEIFMKETYTYSGDYTAFQKKKEEIRNAKMREYLNQRRMIEHQEAVIEKLSSFNREKSIKRAESRKKMLDKIERIDAPVEENTDMRLVLTPDIESGTDVLTVEALSKSFGQKHIFDNVGFEIKKGDRIALIGENGTGKSTILKIINKVLNADSGRFILGTNVHVGYYDQEQQLLDDELTVFDEIADSYPDMTQTRIRNTLAAFLFTGDDVFKKVGDLSGGERGRLSLCRLMLSEANFLILDEPTNHLDVNSIEILENALRSYTGTVLFVSHDRYFVNRVSTGILELAGGKIRYFGGDYDYYLGEKEKLAGTCAGRPGDAKINLSEKEKARQDWAEQKQAAAEKKKKERQLKAVEEEIERLESKKEELMERTNDPALATNSAGLNELFAQIADTEKSLEELYSQWEELA